MTIELPTQPTTEIPQRDTDAHELKPSLPPESVTFADVLQALQAMAGEMAGVRTEMAQLKSTLLSKPSWVTEFFDQAQGIVTRIEVIEAQARNGFPVCHFHHDNGKEFTS